MFLPSDLNAFLQDAQNAINSINYHQQVIDDSQLANDVAAKKPNENFLLYGVLPDYASTAPDEDAMMMGSGFDLLLLKKFKKGNMTLEERIADMDEVARAMRELLEFVVAKMRKGECGHFYFLQEGDIQINPVWGKAGTNGYMMTLNLRD